MHADAHVHAYNRWATFNDPAKVAIRLTALGKRSEAMQRAVKEIGEFSGSGNFIYVCPKKLAELNRLHPLTHESASVMDRVELGLCGSHRERWVAAGRPLRTPEQVETLKAICSECDAKWKLFERALCRDQPCTSAGRCAATYDCPAGKWPAGH